MIRVTPCNEKEGKGEPEQVSIAQENEGLHEHLSEVRVKNIGILLQKLSDLGWELLEVLRVARRDLSAWK